MVYKISEEKEFDLFVQTIEQSSKHIRSLLFFLLVSSAYILSAAYSGDQSSLTMELPIFKTTLPRTWFFIISPMILLFLYIYMHIYIRDLVRRSILFDELLIKTNQVDKKELVFPWLLTITSNKNTHSNPYNLFLTFINNLVLWWFCPLVLFFILLNYINQQNIIALIPCISTAGCLWYIANTHANNKYLKFILYFSGIGLVVLTILTVPSLSQLAGVPTLSEKLYKAIIADGTYILIIATILGSRIAARAKSIELWMVNKINPSKANISITTTIVEMLLPLIVMSILSVVVYFALLYFRYI